MINKALTVTVLTDTHYYSHKIGTSGAAYDHANSKSQKFLAESVSLLRQTFKQVVDDARSDIVLISGDITNNGELCSHEEIIQMLRELKSAGKRVYVITATHDFRKGGVTDGYNADSKTVIPAATREILYDMYKEFGPDEAIAVHRQSMSYIVQLDSNYRLFALNDDSNLTGKSGFSDECFDWIAQQAEKAKADGQFIIAMTHHPLIAPSPLYEIIGRGDMLGDYDIRIRQLADLGIQFIFTGHTHIHNISAYQSPGGNVLYDICSGCPIGYPGVMRSVTFEPDNGVVKVSTDFVEKPDDFSSDLTLKDAFEEQLIGVIKGMIKTAGEDIDKLADMATSISIKPKMIYKFGWVIKPIFKLLNSLKVGTVAKWSKKENGLKASEYAEIKDKKVVDVITELVLNLYGGESKYPPETPTYRITIGFLKIIDSILKTLKIDLKKITKVSSSACELIEPLLYNSKIDSYDADLKIFDFNSTEKLTWPEKRITVKDSKKGLPIIIAAVLAVIALLPIWIIIILIAFLNNQIKFREKLK